MSHVRALVAALLVASVSAPTLAHAYGDGRLSRLAVRDALAGWEEVILFYVDRRESKKSAKKGG